MFDQLGERRGLAAAFEVRGRAHDDAVVTRELGRDEIRIFKIGNADSEIDAFVFQIDDALRKMQRHVQVRMRLDKRRQMWRNVLSAKRGRRGNDQAPRRAARTGRERFLCRAQFVQDIAYILKERYAFRCEGNFACRTPEQLHVQLLFELVDTATDHRGCNALITRNGREAFRFGDIQKCLQCFQAIHVSSCMPDDKVSNAFDFVVIIIVSVT